MLSARKLKKEVFRILQRNNCQDIISILNQYQAKDLIHPLFAAICRHEEQIRWNGIFAFGSVMGRLAVENMESARIVMRRFLWSLNDESGGIGWGAPEAMAESMVNNQRLLDEYLHMLVSYCQEDGEELFQDGNFLELPGLQRGLLWGIARISDISPESFEVFSVAEDMKFYLNSSDDDVRGLALMCVENLGYEDECGEEIQNLREDENEFTFYFKEGAETLIIGDVAERISGNSR